MAITPRHYLDFINHYANLFHEKRSELEEQQMHLNVGLRKIKETVDQVRGRRELPSVAQAWARPPSGRPPRLSSSRALRSSGGRAAS